ncbi:MAG: hypothetical protein HY791_14900 [Deltaproteobacteria bacterium]|nr:hypothetical protein [Deltaproteobacteria bacterium]
MARGNGRSRRDTKSTLDDMLKSMVSSITVLGESVEALKGVVAEQARQNAARDVRIDQVVTELRGFNVEQHKINVEQRKTNAALIALLRRQGARLDKIERKQKS